MESNNRCKVCVTGGGGYIGSALVHSLLQNGYIVNASLINLADESEVGVLRGFPYAKDRLHLFQADIYKPEEFEEAIRGCVIVFHVATALFHTSGYKYNNTTEATVDAAKKIADACIRSGTVKRLIYTATVAAASPLKDDGSGYKNTMDESCWTPLHLNVPYSNDFFKDYTQSKTKTEQELLKIGEEKANELEVVTLALGVVGGRGRLPYASPYGSVVMFISQIAENEQNYHSLRFIEESLGKIPIVHVEDVCRAQIFCAETRSVNGRVFCAASYISSAEIAKHYQKTYPHFNQKYSEELGRDIKWGSKKLQDKGFAYTYDTNMILDDCLEFAKISGHV